MKLLEGVGIDIIEISRIKDAIEKRKRFIGRIFTENEIDYCISMKNCYQHFAARFAAKEATIKALKKRLIWREVEFVNASETNMIARFHGRAREIVGTRKVMVSISHCRSYAVAMAVLVTEGDS